MLAPISSGDREAGRWPRRALPQASHRMPLYYDSKHRCRPVLQCSGCVLACSRKTGSIPRPGHSHPAKYCVSLRVTERSVLCEIHTMSSSKSTVGTASIGPVCSCTWSLSEPLLTGVGDDSSRAKTGLSDKGRDAWGLSGPYETSRALGSVDCEAVVMACWEFTEEMKDCHSVCTLGCCSATPGPETNSTKVECCPEGGEARVDASWVCQLGNGLLEPWNGA